MKRRIGQFVPGPVKTLIRKALAPPASAKLDWFPGPSIERQHFQFRYQGRKLEAAADFTMPLYETIAELVDFDSYRLADISWPTRDPFTVLDIGANIGISGLLFATHPGARVVCYEPVAANCACLRENFALNRMDNYTVVQAAVTARDGEAFFRPEPKVSVGGRMAPSSAPADGLIRVPTVSLESALRACVDPVFLVKMDCEGGEYEIISNMSEETAERIKFLTFEVHDVDRQRNVTAFRSMLERLGYRLAYKPDLYSRPTLHHLLAWRE